MNTWDQIGEFLFAIMMGFGILYVIGTIISATIDTLTLVVGIASITLALSIIYAKRKGKNIKEVSKNEK